MVNYNQPRNKKTNSNNKKDNSKKSSTIKPKRKKSNKSSKKTNKPPSDNEKNKLKKRFFNTPLSKRSIIRLPEKIQMLLAFLTFLTLLTYIIISRQTSHTTEMDLRAYCILSPSGVFWDACGNCFPYFAFKIKNVGKTPAYNVGVYTKFMIKESDFIPTHNMINMPDLNSFIIGGGDETAEQKTLSNILLTKDAFINIRAGKLVIFCIGKVTYIDIFNKKRFLYFGVKYNPDTRLPNSIYGFMKAN